MKWMSMREFLRGGYKDVDDITVVSNHGRPVFTVTPVGTPSPSKSETVVVRSRSGDGDPRLPERRA